MSHQLKNYLKIKKSHTKLTLNLVTLELPKLVYTSNMVNSWKLTKVQVSSLDTKPKTYHTSPRQTNHLPNDNLICYNPVTTTHLRLFLRTRSILQVHSHSHHLIFTSSLLMLVVVESNLFFGESMVNRLTMHNNPKSCRVNLYFFFLPQMMNANFPFLFHIRIDGQQICLVHSSTNG